MPFHAVPCFTANVPPAHCVTKGRPSLAHSLHALHSLRCVLCRHCVLGGPGRTLLVSRAPRSRHVPKMDRQVCDVKVRQCASYRFGLWMIVDDCGVFLMSLEI
jgi:hypothetical protein